MLYYPCLVFIQSLYTLSNLNKFLFTCFICCYVVLEHFTCKKSAFLFFFFVFYTGGDSKTLMMVQVSSVEKNVGETVCSLGFAQRVRAVELGQAVQRTIKPSHSIANTYRLFQVTFVHRLFRYTATGSLISPHTLQLKVLGHDISSICFYL